MPRFSRCSSRRWLACIRLVPLGRDPTPKLANPVLQLAATELRKILQPLPERRQSASGRGRLPKNVADLSFLIFGILHSSALTTRRGYRNRK